MAERKLTRDFDKDFPSNSNKTKSKVAENEKETSKKKVVPITKGKVIVRKKSFGKRFLESFLGDESISVGDYLINDVLVPAMKGTISDLVGGSLDMWLGIDIRGRGKTGYKSNSRDHTSYGSYYGREREDRYKRDDRRELSRDSRSRHTFSDIVLDSRGEAEAVRDAMVDQIIDDGVVSVADYYELVRVESTHTDQTYGWTNLRNATIERVRDGFIIGLPKARPI